MIVEFIRDTRLGIDKIIIKGDIFYFEGFNSIPTALIANDRNRRIQVYQASDG